MEKSSTGLPTSICIEMTRKKFYWSTYFDMYRNDMKKIWNDIKELVNIKVGLNSNISEINRNGESITDPKEIGNTFNNFLCQCRSKYS